MKIALVYCPAVESSGGPAGPELVMPPIGICSLSSYLRGNGYPSDLFDLLLEFDTTVLHEDLRHPLIDDITLFDVYRGAPIPEGKKGVSCRIRYQSDDRTLTDEEVNQHHEKVITRLREVFQAELRA